MDNCYEYHTELENSQSTLQSQATKYSGLRFKAIQNQAVQQLMTLIIYK